MRSSTESYVLWIVVLLVLGGVMSLFAGYRLRRRVDSELFFMIRRELALRAWHFLAIGGGLLLTALCAQLFGVQAVQLIVTPTPTRTNSPTPSSTPTITFTPSQTVSPSTTPSPTITLTLSATLTPTETGTPGYPAQRITPVGSTVTPGPEVVIGLFTFAQDYTRSYEPIGESTAFFADEIEQVVVLFTYTGMTPEVQWTTVWYKDNAPIYIETFPWDGFEAGFAVTLRQADVWEPGNYRVHIYVGEELKRTGEFVVREPPTPTAAPTRTPPP